MSSLSTAELQSLAAWAALSLSYWAVEGRNG